MKLNLVENVHYWLIEEATGRVVDEWQGSNLICIAGKEKLLLAASPKAVNDFNRICIGTGATAAADTNTALQTEVARATGTTSNPSPGIWQVVYTFPAGVGTGMITESALDYQTSPSGAILARQVFTARDKTIGLSLRVQWSIS